MNTTDKQTAGKAIKAEVVSGPVDFDKLGGEEIFLDRPIASFKRIPDNTVVGFLSHKVWLQKPKNAGDIVNAEEADDPHANEWPVYVIALTHDCKVVEGDQIITAKAGREVYLPVTDKLKDLDQYIGQNEMHQIAVAGNGVMPRPGGRTLQKYKIKSLSTQVRAGKYLVGGPQVAQIGVGAGGPGFNQQVATAQAMLQAMGIGGQPGAVPQGTHPLS